MSSTDAVSANAKEISTALLTMLDSAERLKPAVAHVVASASGAIVDIVGPRVQRSKMMASLLAFIGANASKPTTVVRNLFPCIRRALQKWPTTSPAAPVPLGILADAFLGHLRKHTKDLDSLQTFVALFAPLDCETCCGHDLRRRIEDALIMAARSSEEDMTFALAQILAWFVSSGDSALASKKARDEAHPTTTFASFAIPRKEVCECVLKQCLVRPPSWVTRGSPFHDLALLYVSSPGDQQMFLKMLSIFSAIHDTELAALVRDTPKQSDQRGFIPRAKSLLDFAATAAMLSEAPVTEKQVAETVADLRLLGVPPTKRALSILAKRHIDLTQTTTGNPQQHRNFEVLFCK
jgi:hypothetical protein